MTHSRRLNKLSFLHIVPFDPRDPKKGLDEALELFEYAESLGLDGGWVRTRHLQYGLSSPATFLAAASQRTKRLDLGVGVIPTGHENPFRLAEDLSTVDLLSGGRLQPGLSISPPRYAAEVNRRVFGQAWEYDDFSYARIDRFLDYIRGEKFADAMGQRDADLFSGRAEPHSEGLADRIWYGGGSQRSAKWAGEAGLKLLVSNITSAEGNLVFAEAQRKQIEVFRASHPRGDDAVVAQGHVVVPTDGSTREQRERFQIYVEKRTPRTLAPTEAGRLIQRDVYGSTENIVANLTGNIAFQAVDEFLFELPFVFTQQDYRHILHQMATRIGPALGWQPK